MASLGGGVNWLHSLVRLSSSLLVPSSHTESD